MRLLREWLRWGGWIVGFLPGWLAAENPIPPAFGPHLAPPPSEFAAAESFASTNRWVGTYYFYWYDAPSKSHVVDEDGTDALTTHPPTLDGLSFRSVAWHRRQLEDMMAAGIDFLLPVFWGAPSEQERSAGLHWSYEGLPPLVAAREELVRAGKRPPRIGMFYDTSTLQYNAWGEHLDLTTPRGHAWFYATVRDFFSLVPARHWAMVDGHPIVVLYAAAFAKAHNASVVDYLRQAFPRDFSGRTPWLVREVSWNLPADSVVSWGGALGLKQTGGVAALGPGYDHAAVPGRTPLVVERRGGAFYEEQWQKFLRRPSRIVMVETWNEWHEGTDIAESREYGRKFIELTRKYVDQFKQGVKIAWPKGQFSGARSVAIRFGKIPDTASAGLRLLDNEDGHPTPAVHAERPARKVEARPGLGRYLYFAVDDTFKAEDAEFTVEVEYFDAAPGQLTLEFDGSDAAAPFGGAYSAAPERVELTGSQTWRRSRFTLHGARLANSQNGGADFRLVTAAPNLAVGTVTLSRD